MKASCRVSAMFAALLLSPYQLRATELANVNANGMALGEVTATEAASAETGGEDEAGQLEQHTGRCFNFTLLYPIARPKPGPIPGSYSK